MMRVCHLDTCPVGVATQNPVLRERFTGKPEFVENFFTYLAEEVREHLAALGLPLASTRRSATPRCSTPRAARARTGRPTGLDLSPILHVPELPEGASLRQHDRRRTTASTRRSTTSSSRWPPTPSSAASRCAPRCAIRNVNRTVGTMLGSEVSRRYGADGLPDDTIDITFTGSAGQSFGAFLPRGITLRLEGDTNDYVGKGLSGGRVVVRPDRAATLRRRGQRHRRQRHRLRRHLGRDLHPRRRRRALLRPQLRRHRGRRGRRRPRLRVHDRRSRRRPRRDRPQLRRRHVRRHRVRARRRRRAASTPRWSTCCPLDDDDVALAARPARPAPRGDRLAGRRARCSATGDLGRAASPRSCPATTRACWPPRPRPSARAATSELAVMEATHG